MRWWLPPTCSGVVAGRFFYSRGCRGRAALDLHAPTTLTRRSSANAAFEQTYWAMKRSPMRAGGPRVAAGSCANVALVSRGKNGLGQKSHTTPS